jgi:hypothetical protein
MTVLKVDGHVPALLLRLAAPGIPPALSLFAMIAGPEQIFAFATALLPLTSILALAVCFHFAWQFCARERGVRRAGLFVAWVLVSVLTGLAIIAVTLAFTPLTPKPSWLEAK